MEFALTTLQQMFFIRCYYCFFCARVHESYNAICQHAVTPASNTLMLTPLTRACKRNGSVTVTVYRHAYFRLFCL